MLLNLNKIKRFTPEDFFIKKEEKWIILTYNHTLYIAELIQGALERKGISSIIINDINHQYKNNPYIIICPQLFNKNFPERAIFYQMEQSTSPWFSRKYLSMLHKCVFIFDYSLFNIENLIKRGFDISRIFYIPVDFKEYKVRKMQERSTDILFYGALNSHRNQLLGNLSSKFNIKILIDVYGEQLKQELNNAKIVINIHYYKNSILETTRIYEAISNGCIVVSEKTQDMHIYSKLKKLVTFFDYNDIEILHDKLKELLSDPNILIEKQKQQINFISNNNNDFDFYISKFLEYCGYND